MNTFGSNRWRLTDWASYTRTIALVCWSAAVLMTGAMGWSAWRAFDNAADGVDRVVTRHEAGVVAKSRDLFIARR